MEEIDRRTLIAGASILGVAALSRAARAGDLTPPAGPISPTGRSLKEVEPRTPVQSLPGNPDHMFMITQPGSYYLTGDIVVPAGQRAIGVSVQGGLVAIDLCGFSLRGPGGGGGGGSGGIVCLGSPDCLEVFDGQVRDFDGDGIDGGSSRMLDCSDLEIDRCATGIVSRSSMTVYDCACRRCFVDGIRLDKSAGSLPVVFDCDDCDCTGCVRHGVCVSGDFSAGDATLSLRDCDCVNNGSDGINLTIVSGAAGGSSVSVCMDGCACCRNGGIGIRNSTAGQPGQIGARCACVCCDCVCVGNGVCGMRMFNCRCSLSYCDCCDNTGDGFVLDSVEGSIDSCTSSRNTGAGVHLSSACRCSVCDCSSHHNGGEGLAADQACTGLSITECDCQANATGFRVDGAGNMLLWNTASQNGNNYAVSAASSAIVLTPAQLPGSSNPHANYAF